MLILSTTCRIGRLMGAGQVRVGTCRAFSSSGTWKIHPEQPAPSQHHETSPPSSPSATFQYHSSLLLPRNILLLRHGQSLGNVDPTLFESMADWKIPLSERGKLQAKEAGRRIVHLLTKQSQEKSRNNNQKIPLMVYVSPYVRTQQTWKALSAIPEFQKNFSILFVREEPRLREQDFGNFQSFQDMQLAKAERPQFGRFFFRFPQGGESGADVFDRVSAVSGSMRQDWAQVAATTLGAETVHQATCLLITHGITARLFVMKWLHWSVQDFESLHNPPNCGLLHLLRNDRHQEYQLTEASRQLIQAPLRSTDTRTVGNALQLGDLLHRERTKRSSQQSWASSSSSNPILYDDILSSSSSSSLEEPSKQSRGGTKDWDAFDGLPNSAWGL